MTTMLDLLEDGALAGRFLRTVPGPADCPDLSRIWRWSEETARFLRGRTGPGAAVGVLMSGSAECLATLIGGWRAGLRVASLPLPARAMSLPEYFAQLQSVISGLDIGLVAMEEELAASLSGMPVKVVSYPATLGGGPAAPVDEIGSFVQYTSGSVSHPKGVSLSMEALAANALAIMERVGVPDRAIGCSWLPLSHDMGLIGMCLTVWAAQSRAAEGGLVLIRPERFLSRPNLWLETCARFRASITATPAFGLELATRRASAHGEMRLDGIATCIVGAEPVRADTLRGFADAFAPRGFDPGALCPAYGMAEASLAISISPPGALWTSRLLDTEALRRGRWREAGTEGDATEVVALGTPLRGMAAAVDVTEPGLLGELKVRGTSMFDGYVEEDRPLAPEDWFTTSDLGYIEDRQLYVTGRADEVLLIAGRKFFPQDLEAAAATVEGVRRHSTAAISLRPGKYAMVVECPPGDPDGRRLRRLCRDVRMAVARRTGLGPDSVVVIPRGSLPRTASGKHQRRRLATRLAENRIPPLAEIHFD